MYRMTFLVLLNIVGAFLGRRVLPSELLESHLIRAMEKRITNPQFTRNHMYTHYPSFLYP